MTTTFRVEILCTSSEPADDLLAKILAGGNAHGIIRGVATRLRNTGIVSIRLAVSASDHLLASSHVRQAATESLQCSFDVLRPHRLTR